MSSAIDTHTWNTIFNEGLCIIKIKDENYSDCQM